MSYKQALLLSWVLFGGLIAGYGYAASSRGPDGLPGCIYNTSPPTLSDGQSVTFQCDVNGNLKTKAQ